MDTKSRYEFIRNYMLIKRNLGTAEVDNGKHYFFSIVHLIYKNDNYLRISDIVNKTILSKGRVTQVLNALEEDGYIIKNYENNSRKQVYVSLSEKGLAKYHNNLPIIEKKIDELIELVGVEDVIQLNRIVNKILNGGQNENH